MSVQFKLPLSYRIKAGLSKILDWAISPISNTLTHDEYFSCRTRRDILRVYFRNHLIRRS